MLWSLFSILSYLKIYWFLCQQDISKASTVILVSFVIASLAFAEHRLFIVCSLFSWLLLFLKTFIYNFDVIDLVFCLVMVTPASFFWLTPDLPLYLLKYFEWYKQYPKRELWQHREDPTKRYILICLCYSNELSPKCAKPHPNGFACVWAPRLHRDLVDDYRDKSIQIAESHFGRFWMKFAFSWNCTRNPLRLPEFF